MKKKKAKIVTADRYHKYADIDEMYSTKHRNIKLTIPSNLRMLCAIFEVKVEDLLYDFMWMLSYSAISGATNKQRKAARKFFLLCRYGQPQYSEKEINQIFDELKAGREIYDTIDGMDQNDMELFWRNNHMYWQHWFKRWFKKNTREDDISVLEKY